MTRFLTIALKDLRLALRDRAALLLMLLAPFLLTVGMGFVTGRLTGTASGPSAIGVIIVDQDKGALADAMIKAFDIERVRALVNVQRLTDEQEARARVRDDKAAAAIVIPPGFTDSVFSPQPGQASVRVERYGNPLAPTSVSVIDAVLSSFLGEVETGRIGGLVAVEAMLKRGLVAPQDIARYASEMGQRLSAGTATAEAVVLRRSTVAVNDELDVLALLAPGMALLFLMYTVTRGASLILAERDGSTLARLFATPTATASILGGKIAGVFLTGAAQVGILIAASGLIFGVKWGDPLGVIALVLASAAAATAWGVFILAFAKSREQVTVTGSALMMLFAILSRSFGNMPLPEALQGLGKLTPNYWGLDGFGRLAQGQSFAAIAPNLTTLLIMTGILFAVGVIGFRKLARA